LIELYHFVYRIYSIHKEIYQLIDRLEQTVEKYSFQELKALGSEFRKNAEKKDISPLEEILFRRVGGLISEIYRFRSKNENFAAYYLDGFNSYPSASDEINSQIRTLMVIGHAHIGKKQSGKRIRTALNKLPIKDRYVNYMVGQSIKMSTFGNDTFKMLAKGGFVHATNEHMIATFLASKCSLRSVNKAKQVLSLHGFPI